ncbi:Clp protease N-terminal domain-containing protein [Streptomyces sp. NPDC001604]|uniref:Clp protease N-terminal domain-containing protein n=1 Tax=Streptomyces sp. NPDC001604 TaxID=3364593 RepID=UPI003690D269
MFERFTKDARGVVQAAVEQAERAEASSVEAEHILLALLEREGSRASFAFTSLGVTVERKESIREAVAESRRRAGLSRSEADALAGLGIDVSEIVARVEAVHGVGAMSGDRRDKGWWSGRRSFGRGAKQILETSLRTAVAHGDRHIGDEHILLALTARPGIPAEILADRGVTYESLMRVLFGGGGEAKAG